MEAFWACHEQLICLAEDETACEREAWDWYEQDMVYVSCEEKTDTTSDVDLQRNSIQPCAQGLFNIKKKNKKRQLQGFLFVCFLELLSCRT